MKTKTNKSIFGLAMIGLITVSFSACKKDNDNSTTATLLITNTVEGSAAQDVYLNGNKSNISAVAYASAASSLSTNTDVNTISFKNTGTANESASAGLSLTANASQSVYLVKQANGNLAVSIYANENTAPSSGKARVRFINFAPLLTSSLNVTTSAGVSLINSLAFRASSAYQEVNAATALNVNVSGSLDVTTVAASEIQAGKIYTIWFDNSTSTKVKYHVVVEN